MTEPNDEEIFYVIRSSDGRVRLMWRANGGIGIASELVEPRDLWHRVVGFPDADGFLWNPARLVLADMVIGMGELGEIDTPIKIDCMGDI